jgi:ABC-type nitrate/sulfonate/bicarbonate transport system permease component
MPPFVRTLLEAILGLAIIAAAWVVASGMVDNAAKLPSLPSVVQRAIELAPSDDFLRDFGDSATALLLGLLPALLAGVFLGMIAGMSRGTRWLFGPFAVTLGGAPLVLLVPLFFAWWGVTIVTKAAAVFIMVGFPIMNMVMVATGARRPLLVNTNESRRHAPIVDANAHAANTAAGAIAIIGGLRVGVVIGVTALAIVEFMAGNHGVGYFIAQAASAPDMTAAMAGIILVAVPTLLMAAFLQAIQEQVAG